MEKMFLTEQEVARLMSLSLQTLRNWRFQGRELPYVKCGRAVRYRYDDVLGYMEDRLIVPREESRAEG